MSKFKLRSWDNDYQVMCDHALSVFHLDKCVKLDSLHKRFEFMLFTELKDKQGNISRRNKVWETQTVCF